MRVEDLGVVVAAAAVGGGDKEPVALTCLLFDRYHLLARVSDFVSFVRNFHCMRSLRNVMAWGVYKKVNNNKNNIFNLERNDIIWKKFSQIFTSKYYMGGTLRDQKMFHCKFSILIVTDF